MTEAMPFLQKYDITFLRPLPIWAGSLFYNVERAEGTKIGFVSRPP